MAHGVGRGVNDHMEVWYAIPSANAANCAKTLPEWRARGYRIALLQDQNNRFEAVADLIVAPFERYRGYGASINHLIRNVVPRSVSIIVTGGDDMYPDMARTAAEIAEEFLQRFPDTFGIMQPVGDRFGSTDSICGSPWIGRAFAQRAYAGSGPYCAEYFQLYEDQELHDVALRLGVLWKRPDLCQLHEHWEREKGSKAPAPEYLKASLARGAESRAIFERRRAADFPGHEPLAHSSLSAPSATEFTRRGGREFPLRPPMKLIGLMPARNEEWIIGLSLSVALRYCDEMIVSDHGSTDATREVIEQVSREHPGRVHLIEDDSAHWSEMRIRGKLLHAARERSATHIALIDADEIISANLLPRIREIYRQGCIAGFAMRLPMISPWAGMERFRTDGAFRAPLHAGFALTPSLSYEIPASGYELHGRIPSRLHDLPMQADGGVMHMQFCSLRRLRAKAVWYKMNEVLRHPGRIDVAELNKQYDWALSPGPTETMRDEWFAPYQGLAATYLNPDAEPWQEEEIAAMLDEHGPERFAGIETHGLLKRLVPT